MEVNQETILRAAGNWVTAAVEGDLPSVVGKNLMDWMHLQELVFLEFRKDAAPKVLGTSEFELGDPELRIYLSKTYLIDPWYNVFQRGGPWGFTTLRDILPDWKELEEPWQDYQQFANLLDECGYLIPLSSEVAINVSFIRGPDGHEFGDHAISLARVLEPLISSVCKLYWLRHHADAELEGRRIGFARINSVFSSFGSSVLTPREQEMMQLLLRGYSAKLIAEAMGISLGTVNVHRANIYNKLDISSYKELFSLFIDAVSSVDAREGEDIYAAYCSPPSRL